MAVKYMRTAHTIMVENPAKTGISPPSRIPITEALPFIPHAHGTKLIVFCATILSPVGNGIPMKKARGATSPTESRIRVPSGMTRK